MCTLREIRINKGLRRNFVASKLNIVADHLNRLERGDTPTNIFQLEVMSQLYNCDLGELTRIAINTAKEAKAK